MCFIKSIYNKDSKNFKNNLEQLTNTLAKNLNNYSELEKSIDFEKNLESIFMPSPLFKNIASLILRNSELTKDLEQKIQNVNEKTDFLIQEVSNASHQVRTSSKRVPKQLSIVSSTFQNYHETVDRLVSSSNKMVNKVFGQAKYAYKLKLINEFPTVIYKDRNIKLDLCLFDLNGVQVKNANIINLTLALCDVNGEWIENNRVGDPMLRGKTQTQLYHGQSEFNKICTRDISRTFPCGVVNVVVYPQPSVLVYNGGALEQQRRIDEKLIEPFVIEGVVIMAKKKN